MKAILFALSLGFGLSEMTLAAAINCAHSSTFGVELDQGGLNKMNFKGVLRVKTYEPSLIFLVSEIHLELNRPEQGYCKINPSDSRLVACWSGASAEQSVGKVSWVDSTGKETTIETSLVSLRTTRRLETSGSGVTEDSFDILVYFTADGKLYEISDRGYYFNDECHFRVAQKKKQPIK